MTNPSQITMARKTPISARDLLTIYWNAYAHVHGGDGFEKFNLMDEINTKITLNDQKAIFDLLVIYMSNKKRRQRQQRAATHVMILGIVVFLVAALVIKFK